MALPKDLITNRTAKLPGDWRKQPAPSAKPKGGGKKRGLAKAAHLARFLATPPGPLLTETERQSQRGLFEKHDVTVVSLRLPLAPTLNSYRTIFQPTDRHGRPAGRPRLITSAAGRAYCEAVKFFWRQHCGGETPEPLTGRLRLLVVVHMTQHRDTDLDNRIKPLQDAMQEAGIFQDDAQIDDLRVLRGDVIAGTGALDATLEVVPG